MKILIANLLLISAVFAGFYNESEVSKVDVKKQEDQRLCQLFTDKAEKYRETMRSDELATATLESYEKRADMYCTRVQNS